MTSGLSNPHLKYPNICLSVPPSSYKLTSCSIKLKISILEGQPWKVYFYYLFFYFQNEVQGIQKRTHQLHKSPHFFKMEWGMVEQLNIQVFCNVTLSHWERSSQCLKVQTANMFLDCVTPQTCISLLSMYFTIITFFHIL